MLQSLSRRAGLATSRGLSSTKLSISARHVPTQLSSIVIKFRTFSTEPFLNGDASPYLERMYDSWCEDPKSVHVSWDAYFRNLNADVPSSRAFTVPPVGQHFQPSSTPQGISDPYSSRVSDASSQSSFDTSKVIQLVRGYQGRGHEFAQIDPLGLPHEFPFVSTARRDARHIPIDYKSYGFTEQDLDRLFDCRVPGVTGFLSADRPQITLRQLVQRLEETYCGHIGIEANHIEDSNVTNYLRQVLEGETKFQFSDDMRRRILVRTAR